MSPPGPARPPYGPGGAPVPPRDHMRPREAPRPGHPMPGRESMPGREGAQGREGMYGHTMPGRDGMPGHAMPGREGMPRNEGMPRPEPAPGAGMPPRGAGPQRPHAPRHGAPGRPGAGPMPPREPGYPPPPGQGRGAGYGPGHGQPPPPGFGPGRPGGTGRHARGAGHAAPGARRPGGPYQGPSEPAGQFEGGYAQVIRASDSPVRPAPRRGSARPGDPGRPASPPGDVSSGVFVYRDTAGQPGDAGANDPSYWYDLSGAGQEPESPHAAEEARGPFEPLVSSADPPGTVRHAAAEAADAAEAAEAGDGRGTGDGSGGPDAEAGAPEADGLQDVAHAHARKLEQIKDLYLTAEAIGEANVDKHFDQLLSQQRELISEYFRQSSAAKARGGTEGADEADAVADAPAEPQAPEPPAPEPPAPGSWFVPENARVTADQPRAW